MRTIIFAFLLGFAATAHAQVYKCTDAAGKAIFSDQPCDAHGAKGGPIQRGRTADEIYRERMQALEATEQKYQRRAAEREQQAFDQQMSAARQRQAIEAQPAPERLNDTTACKKARKDLEFVSGIRTLSQDELRMRTNAAITNVNASCGTNTPLMQEPPKLPARVASCDATGCYSKDGIFREVRPDLRVGPDGRTCRLRGDLWYCD